MSTYDYLIVGSGLFGAVFAHEASMRGKKCLVLEKREHVGGNVYCEELEESWCIATARIFFTLVIRRFGNMSASFVR